jgi:Xaa-Pro aminopeptidase
MRGHRCTHLLVTDAVDVEYLCGFSASHAALLLTPDGNFLCADFRYREAAKRFCAHQRSVRFVKADGERFSFLAPLVAAGSVVGFQSDVVTVDELEKLKRELHGVRFAGIAGEISDIALAKTAAERLAMRKAARIGDASVARLFTTLRPGITEREAASALDRIAAGLGSAKCAFDTIVLFGGRTSLPHGRPGSRRLKRGDLILVDAGCTVRGLCSDMTRMAVYGPPSSRQREVYGIVREAQAAALRAARAGIAASSLDRAGRRVIEKAGYGKAFGHGLGHGVGRRIHERPSVSARSKETLKEKCVVTIEPGIYLPGFGGVRIEDMAVLTKKGYTLLTHASRELIEL